jgi:FADH2 O2-dependent halogenase
LQSLTFDIVILGAGFVGSSAALAFTKCGFKVAFINKYHHPMFSVGESTTPELNNRLKRLAKRLDCWEFEAISSYRDIKKRSLAINTMPKESFCFLHHRVGKSADPDDEVFYQTSPWPKGPDHQFQRDDVDDFLCLSAISYGASYFSDSLVKCICEVEDGWKIQLEREGVEFQLEGQFLVDASGRDSLFVKQLELDREYEGFMNSGTIFTHMTGLNSADKVMKYDKMIRRDFSTQHHYADGHWLWIIPLSENHTSIGLVRDNNFVSVPFGDPQAYFDQFIAKYPTLSKIFENTTRIRPWVVSERMQYSTKTSIGKRFVLTPNTAGFIDPLLSTGLALNISAIERLLDLIKKAFDTGDFRLEKFESYDRCIQTEIKYIDKVIHTHFLTFNNPRNFEFASIVQKYCFMSSLGGLDKLNDSSDQSFCLWRLDLKPLQDFINDTHSYILSREKSLNAEDLKETMAKHPYAKIMSPKIMDISTPGMHYVTIRLVIGQILKGRGEKVNLFLRVGDVCRLIWRFITHSRIKDKQNPMKGMRMRGLLSLFKS